MRLRLHETGQVQVDGAWVAAANIATRGPFGSEGAVALRAQIGIDEDPAFDVTVGEEIEIAGARWRVAEIVEDPVHQRGDVFLERAQD